MIANLEPFGGPDDGDIDRAYEQLVRESAECICGKPKLTGDLVCWDCFKHGPHPLKYSGLDYATWAAKHFPSCTAMHEPFHPTCRVVTIQQVQARINRYARHGEFGKAAGLAHAVTKVLNCLVCDSPNLPSP